MSGQHLDQYVVDDYIRETGILNKIQAGLNMAIEQNIKNPESFLADYLLQGIIAQQTGILLSNIYVNARNQILYTVTYLNVLRTFSFQIEPEVLQKLSEKPPSFPIQVLQQLVDIDLTVSFTELCAKVKEALEEHYQVVVQHFISIVSTLLRKPQFDTLLHSLRLGKQLYSLPRLIIGVIDSPLFKFQVVQIKQKTYDDVIQSFEHLQVFIGKIDNTKTLCSIQVNEKTGEFTTDGLPFETSDILLRNREQTIEHAAELELNKDIRMQPVERPPSAKGGKGAKGGAPAPALTQIQMQVLMGRNVAKMLEGLEKSLTVFLSLDLSKLDEQKVTFNDEERNLYLLLLNTFMESSQNIIIHFTNLSALPSEAAKRPASGKGGAKGGKGAPVEVEKDQFVYSKDEVIKDIQKAVKDYKEISQKDVQLFMDVKNEILNNQTIKMVPSESKVNTSTTLQEFYDALAKNCCACKSCELSASKKIYESDNKEEAKNENKAVSKQENQESQDAAPPPVQEESITYDAKILTFMPSDEADRPVSGKGGKAPAKAPPKGKGEVEKPQRCPFISIGEASLLESKEFVYFEEKGDIEDFVGGVWQFIADKRAIIGI